MSNDDLPLESDGTKTDENAREKLEFDPSALIKSLPNKPGVYRMLDDKDHVIYVGKAGSLKKRVASYFQKSAQSPKTHSMVAQVSKVETTITRTEGEALLLENNLIKEYKPRYNILLRDDKSYPYIYLSTDQQYPRLSFHRGARKGKGRYFGPYPGAGAVRESLNLIQKLFQVRQCEDSFFRNRSRPCLQYQIKRCTAPCVGFVTEAEYAEDINHAVMFLEGKSSHMIDEFVKKMEAAAQSLEYEKAARFRDQIATLRRVQEKQYVSRERGDIDVVCCVMAANLACVTVLFIRGGSHLGHKTFYPKQTQLSDASEVLAAFLSQYYLAHRRRDDTPPLILINQAVAEKELLQQVITEQCSHKVEIVHNVRGERARWIEMAQTNASTALNTHVASKANLLQRFEQLQDALNLETTPQRMECFDISHTSGEATVASCVVMDTNGPVKSDYRRFNIKGITAGDDYAAMQQALTRRYTKLKEGEGKLPDILIIDGGKGQLAEAEKVLEECQINDIALIGVAKGPERKPGMETLFLSGQRTPIILPEASPALHLLQQIRDEAHRFAITGHRQRRAKTRNQSTLEGIAGMGPKRRQQLLKQFGGLQGITRAGVEDIASVPGISKQLAQRIYDILHPDQ